MEIINLDTSPFLDIENEQEQNKFNINTIPDIYTYQEYNEDKTKQQNIYARIISKISHRSPFIRQLLEFNIEQSYIKFEGYYYVENSNEKIPDYGYNLLPQIVIIVYRGLDNRKYYLSEVYNKEVIEDTSVYSYDQDEDLKICCFPTAIIRLQFRILEIYDKLDVARKRMNEI